MDQIKIGKFIAECRKKNNLTQMQLADKLNITDRAISKWENGKAMPDSAIMLDLCSELKISVNELLSGEKISMKDYDKKAEKNLIELKRKDENNIMRNTIISIAFSSVLFIGILVCIICDLAISSKFTWSIITTSSIIFAWLVLIPIIRLGKKGITRSLIVLSIIIIPYLYILSISVKEISILSIGTIMSLITIIYIWCIFGIFKLLKTKKIKAIGITFLLSIPFCLIINITLSKMILEPIIDIWDILSAFILLILASIFFVWDYSKSKRQKQI